MTAVQTWRILETDWADADAQRLRDAMDAELHPRYASRLAERAADPDEPNAFAVDPATIVATLLVIGRDGRAVGHAALRQLGEELEVKRVFVEADARGSGASRALMAELERIARDRGARRLILQTGDRQPEAVGLYERIGYTRIPIFAPYLGYDFSNCFEKVLDPAG